MTVDQIELEYLAEMYVLDDYPDKEPFRVMWLGDDRSGIHYDGEVLFETDDEYNALDFIDWYRNEHKEDIDESRGGLFVVQGIEII